MKMVQIKGYATNEILKYKRVEKEIKLIVQEV